jgi:hypothetical protein
MAVLEEYVILFCETPAAVGGNNRFGVSEWPQGVRVSLLEALQQNLKYPIRHESCSVQDLPGHIRSLKDLHTILVLLSQSLGPETLTIDLSHYISDSIIEIGERNAFLAISDATMEKDMIDAFANVRRYVIPEQGNSSASATQFRRVIDTLALDISGSLSTGFDGNIEGARGGSASSVFLAPVPERLESLSRKLRIDLESKGFTVNPKTNSDVLENLETHLSESRLSIHLFGQTHADLAERGDREGMDVFRTALSFTRTHSEFRVLGWTDSQAPSETLVVGRISHSSSATSLLGDQILRESKEFSLSAEVIQSTIEDFKSLLYDRLGQSLSAFSVSNGTPQKENKDHPATGAQLYVIYDSRDAEAAEPVTNFLHHQGISVLLPEFPAEQSKLRAIHNENLRLCDGVLILYGSVQEQWVRMKQQDLLRAAALGRKKGIAAKGVFLCSNKTEGKLRFKAPDMMIINGFDSTMALGPFLQKLSAL